MWRRRESRAVMFFSISPSMWLSKLTEAFVLYIYIKFILKFILIQQQADRQTDSFIREKLRLCNNLKPCVFICCVECILLLLSCAGDLMIPCLDTANVCGRGYIFYKRNKSGNFNNRILYREKVQTFCSLFHLNEHQHKRVKAQIGKKESRLNLQTKLVFFARTLKLQ